MRNICIEFFCYPSSSDIKKTVISNIIKYFDQNNNEEKSDSTNSNQGKIYSTTGPLFNYESGIFLNNFLKDNRILNKSSILINLGVGNGIGFYELLTGFLEIFDRRKINEILENRIAKNKKYTTNIREMIESVNLKIKEKRDIDIYAYEKYDYIPELTKTMINIRHDSLLDFFNNIKIEIDSKRDSNIIFIIQSPPPYSGSGIEVIYCAFIINHFNRLIFENNNVYIYFTGELGNTDGILGLPNWLNDNSSLESVRTMSEIINEDDIKGRTIFRVKNSTMPNNHVDIYNKSLQYFHKSLQYFNILNTDTCIERLRGWLHNEKIMDKFGNINQDNKLTYEIYNQYIQANNSSGLSKNVIDDCLIKLGLSIPINE